MNSNSQKKNITLRTMFGAAQLAKLEAAKVAIAAFRKADAEYELSMKCQHDAIKAEIPNWDDWTFDFTPEQWARAEEICAPFVPKSKALLDIRDKALGAAYDACVEFMALEPRIIAQCKRDVHAVFEEAKHNGLHVHKVIDLHEKMIQEVA